MDQIEQSLEEQKPLRGAKSRSEQNAVELACAEASLHRRFGRRPGVHEATDHFVPEFAQPVQLCFDEGANDLGREVRRIGKIDAGRIEAKGKNGGHRVCCVAKRRSIIQTA